MRLRDVVARDGFDSFNTDDFAFVGRRVDRDPDRLILVGGQALETWGHVLDVPRPNGEFAPLTDDLDWLGSKQDAIWLCEQLGRGDTDLQLAGSVDDPSVSTALAYLRRPDGRILMLDFLRAIVGPDGPEVRALAVPIRVSTDQDSYRLNILHPLHCLHSRLANLEKLPVKRKGNGPLQGRWAIDIAEGYLRKRLQDGAAPRELIRICHKIAENAEYKSGPYCFDNFGLDPLMAVKTDIVGGIGGAFEQIDWPNTVARIEAKRERRMARQDRA